MTAALPGLEAFLMLERLRIMSGDAALKDRYVIIDGPAWAAHWNFCRSPKGSGNRAARHPQPELASGVHSFLIDGSRFGVAITVSPEEMALREALETADALKRRGIKWIVAVLNSTSKVLFDAADLAALTPLKAHAHLALRRNTIAEYTIRAREQLKAASLPSSSCRRCFCPSWARPKPRNSPDQLEKTLTIQ